MFFLFINLINYIKEKKKFCFDSIKFEYPKRKCLFLSKIVTTKSAFKIFPFYLCIAYQVKKNHPSYFVRQFFLFLPFVLESDSLYHFPYCWFNCYILRNSKKKISLLVLFSYARSLCLLAFCIFSFRVPLRKPKEKKIIFCIIYFISVHHSIILGLV